MKIAVIGYGGRGRLYTSILKDKHIEVEAICDTDKEKLELAKRELSLPDGKLYADENEFFSKGKLADILFVCTQDALHYGHAIRAMKLGYDLLLEKPIAASVKQCREIQQTAHEYNRNVFVCHVLRYAPFFTNIKKQLASGKYGKVVTLSLTENVAYWHQAHSYVRGSWRNDNFSTPMIIAKCCHDLDLISWFIGDDCESVTSYGSLDYFTAKNAPEGSADRCLDCKFADTCVYSAKKIYITDRAAKGNLQ